MDKDHIEGMGIERRKSKCLGSFKDALEEVPEIDYAKETDKACQERKFFIFNPLEDSVCKVGFLHLLLYYAQKKGEK